MGKIFWFIKQSLILDYKFIKVSRWSFARKIEFILKKYKTLLLYGFKKFELGKDFVVLSGEALYYGNKFGISDYQGVLARHQNLLQIANINIGKNGVVIDVGANVGFFSKLIRNIYPQASIYCVEPIASTFECLKKNFEKDKNTYLFNLAFGDKKGRQKMSFNDQRPEISQVDTSGNVIVSMKLLDDFAKEKNIKKIDLLKIDTEGFEDKVLLGAKEILAKTAYVFIEVTLENNTNYTLASLMSCLYSDSYNFNLVGFRNFGDTSEGKAPVLDCLLKNIKL